MTVECLVLKTVNFYLVVIKLELCKYTVLVRCNLYNIKFIHLKVYFIVVWSSPHSRFSFYFFITFSSFIYTTLLILLSTKFCAGVLMVGNTVPALTKGDHWALPEGMKYWAQPLSQLSVWRPSLYLCLRNLLLLCI